MPEKLDRENLEGLKAAWLQHLMLRNLSPLSIRQMDQGVRLFVGYLNGRGITDAGKVDAELFENYKAQISTEYMTRKGAPLHQNTVQARLCIVQRWFAWLKKKGVLFFNPIMDVKVPRTLKHLPKGVMRPDEIRKVMEQPDLRSPIGYRDRTMMEVLYSTGARAAELVGLKVPDVDLKKKIIRIRNGKGGTDRFAPLSTPCCRFLERYLTVVRPELMEGMRPAGNNWLKKSGTGGDLVFLSAYGGGFSSSWLGEVMKRYIARAGVLRPTSPVHGFRHSVATHLIEDGMDVRYVQVLLGHSAITSTQIYTHVERKTLHEQLKAHHPRELAGETPLPFVFEGKGGYAVAA